MHRSPKAQRACDLTSGQLAMSSADKRRGPLGFVRGAVLVWLQRALGDNWELQLRIVHLNHMVAPALGRLDDCSIDDLNCPWVRPVATSHLLEHLAHCTVERDVAVLLVHVMGVGAALVPQPDGVVLHLHGLFFEDLVYSQQLTSTPLRLVEPLHEIPEARCGQHSVLREETHSVNLWGGPFGCGCCTAHNLVLVHLLPQGWIQLELQLLPIFHKGFPFRHACLLTLSEVGARLRCWTV